MQVNNTYYNPFVRRRDSTGIVMTDVTIALLPAVVISWFAWGFAPIAVVLVAVGSALLAEAVFTAVFFKRTKPLADGSAVVTGILLAFTIGPFTPLWVVAFGGAAAVVFGKLLWGGVGRNRFNPALTGREFMVIFFPVIMNSSSIWSDSSQVNMERIELFGNEFFDRLFFNPSGAIGEYSPILLVLGGFYLLYRRRISWHIPFAMLAVFTLLMLVFIDRGINFTLGGLLVGAIYMATDMPTSSSTKAGKFYFGAMIAVVAITCLLFDVEEGYSSYSILIMNGFVHPINWVFRTHVWGTSLKARERLWQGALLTFTIIAATLVVILLHRSGMIALPVLLFIGYTVARYIIKDRNKT